MVAARAESAEDLIAAAERTRRPFDPEVTLFLADSPESNIARQMFAAVAEDVRVISSPEARMPTAVFAFSAYEGLPAIAELIEELQSLRRATIAAYERHVRHRARASAERRPVSSRQT